MRLSVVRHISKAMASPRRLTLQLLPAALTLLIWTLLLALLPTGWLTHDIPALIAAAAPPLLINLSVALILFVEWKSGTQVGIPIPENQAELEVIPPQRRRPPGLVRHPRRGRVVLVPKRKIRHVPKPNFTTGKRRALGLKELPSGRLNRRKPTYWQRRIVW